MTAGLLRVSVVAGTRRLDLALPPTLPVAELVPGLAHRLGVASYAGLRLCTATGSVLDDHAGLAPQDVPDGSVLVLAEPPPPAAVHDDPTEALREVLDETARPRPARDPVPADRRSRLAAGAALVLLAGVPLAAAGDARIPAVLALLLLAGGLAVGRSSPVPAVVSAFTAGAHAALATVLLATGLPRAGPGVPWAAAGAAILVVASLAMAGLPAHRLRLLPAVVVGAVAAVVGALLSVRDVPFGELASLLLGLCAVVAAGLPWVAVGRITRPRGRVDVEALAGEVRTARELLVGASAGLAAVHLALVPVAARHGPAGLALAGCASALALLRARHHARTVEALPGVAAGALGLLVTVGVGLWQHDAWRTAGGIALGGVGIALLAHARAPDSGETTSLLARPLLRSLEVGCLVTLLPLVVLASGALESLP